MTRVDDPWDEDDEPIVLGGGGEEQPDLGPDEHDLDLMDGSWEAEYYAGRHRARNWGAIVVGIALLVLLAMIVPAITVLFH